MEKSAAAYKTISEAALELGVEQHVLRFWETQFPQIKPLKRAGGRRFYRPEDMEVLRHIQGLLKTQGFTIKGAKKNLHGKKPAETAVEPAKEPVNKQYDLLGNPAASPQPAQGLSPEQRQKLETAAASLKSLRNRLQSIL